MCEQQQQVQQLLALQAKYPEQCMYKTLDEYLDYIICYVCPGDNPDEQWHTALSQQMLEQTVKWFHRLWDTLENNFCMKHCNNVMISPKLR